MGHYQNYHQNQLPPFTLNRFMPGSRPDVFKKPIYDRNLHLYQLVQTIPNETNRMMFRELEAVDGHPEVIYTKYAITVGQFATSKILSLKRRDRKKKDEKDSDSEEEFE
jgi:hypothetical protein